MLNVLKTCHPLRIWQHEGVMLNILKMSRPLRVLQHLGVMIKVLNESALESMAASR